MKKVNGRYVGQLKTAMFGKVTIRENGTIATAEVAGVNRQTPLQMARRITWSNIIATYRVMREGLREGWENIPHGQSLYNQFIAVNAKAEPYALTRDDFKAGACVVAPYQVTRGSLEPIYVDTSRGVAFATTNIILGELQVTNATTIGEFAEAIVSNNPDWRYGDKLTYFSLVQYVKAGVPRVAMSYAAITLLEDSEVVLSSEVALTGLVNVDGVLGHDSAAPVGGFCWVHSRHDVNGALLLSNQSIVTNNDDIIARYTSVKARCEAAKSYGANFQDLKILEPADAEVKRIYNYFGIRFDDAQGQTTVPDDDLRLTGLRYRDQFVFDGDQSIMLEQAKSATLTILGSNLSVLEPSTTKVSIDGTEISNVSISGNMVTVTLPSSMTSQQLTRLTLTDGTTTTSLALKA